MRAAAEFVLLMALGEACCALALVLLALLVQLVELFALSVSG